MERVKTALELMQKDCYFIKVGLKDAYFYLRITEMWFYGGKTK